jgi:uncharacterized protein
MIERRFISPETQESGGLAIEHRDGEAGEGSQSWLVGYAAVFGSDSVSMDGFTEQIDSNAFRIVAERRGRKRPLQTRALYNHDSNHVLGRYPTTLKLRVDDVGLRYEVLLPKSREDLRELVERGDLKGSSFAFTVAKGGERWEQREDGTHLRVVTEIEDLYDVGPVTYPAYSGTEGLEVVHRSLDAIAANVKTQARRQAELANEVRGRRLKILANIEGVVTRYGRT